MITEDKVCKRGPQGNLLAKCGAKTPLPFQTNCDDLVTCPNCRAQPANNPPVVVPWDITAHINGGMITCTRTTANAYTLNAQNVGHRGKALGVRHAVGGNIHLTPDICGLYSPQELLGLVLAMLDCIHKP